MNSILKSNWSSFLMALSRYSFIRKYRGNVTKENSEFILLYIPFIGLVITLVFNQWAIAYPYLFSYTILPAVIGAVLPSIVSGGSHLDGFFRTVDAMCSHEPIDRKLEILEDAHGGYFAIIVCVCYFFIAIGVWSEMAVNGWFILSYGMIISRSLYGIALLLFKHAKECKATCFVPTGGRRYVVIAILMSYIVISIYFMLQKNVELHNNVEIVVGILVAALISFIYFWIVSVREFGGVTEDSAGFFVQICEVAMPIAALLIYKKWW